MNRRLDQLRAAMQERELDAFLVTSAANRRYLSGFTGSSGALLVRETAQWLVTDFRYVEQAGQQAPMWTLHRQTQTLPQAIAELLGQVRPARLGFEADALTVADFHLLRRVGPEGLEWAPTEGVVTGLRAVKEPEEVETMRRAQAITDRVVAELPALIQPGRTEREVAWAIEKRLRDHGADGPAFAVTVASGPNAALPHHKPGARRIERGEAVLVDCGALLDGYHSDLTRTFFTGQPPDDFRRVYEVVLEAQRRAEAALRPGLGLKAGDAIARDWIAAQGYGEQFGHSLGHGVGLEIHELPQLSFRVSDEKMLAAGHVVTVEPGIYLPGRFGVRVEDLVLVTEAGSEVLTTASRDVNAWQQGQP